MEKQLTTFCHRECDICTKLCYPNQVVSCWPPPAVVSYLPANLKHSANLLVCYRCKIYLSSKETVAPAKAYWNHLDPGVQHDVLNQLTQSQQWLLSRIIPFVKVVKFDGHFGQYCFQGKAVLFAQDIFEFSEKLPNMLLRSSVMLE